jgi:hypothetical protein
MMARMDWKKELDLVDSKNFDIIYRDKINPTTCSVKIAYMVDRKTAFRLAARAAKAFPNWPVRVLENRGYRFGNHEDRDYSVRLHVKKNRKPF